MSEQIIKSGNFTVTGPLDDPTEFKAEVQVGHRGVEITATAKDGLIRVMFESLLESFRAHGGENYVEYCVQSGGEAFRILLQRDGGETPSQQNTRLRAEVDRLTSNLRTAEGVIERNEASIERLTRERDEAELILDRTCKYIADKMPLSGVHSVFENIDAAVAERDQLREQLEQARTVMAICVDSLNCVEVGLLVDEPAQEQVARVQSKLREFIWRKEGETI